MGMVSSIPTVLSWGGNISPGGFLPSILLLEVIIVAVAIIVLVVVDAIIGVVVVISGVPSIIKLSFVIIGFEVVTFPSILLGNPPMKTSMIFSVFGVPVGPLFLLGLLILAIVTACASRAAATSFLMAAEVMTGAADVDVAATLSATSFPIKISCNPGIDKGRNTLYGLWTLTRYKFHLLLSYSGLSDGFWEEAMLTTYCLLNKGAVVRLSDPKKITLGEKGIDCIFVGYAEHSKAYRPKDVMPNLVESQRDDHSDDVPIGSQYSYRYSIEEDPRTYDEAMQSRDVCFLKEAIDDEIDCSPVSTPMDPVEKLKPNTVDQVKYSRAISCLMYVMTSTRPDIAYAVEAYSDARWINHVEDSSFTSGWVFLLGGGAILWASKKQTCITEFEFAALAAAEAEFNVESSSLEIGTHVFIPRFIRQETKIFLINTNTMFSSSKKIDDFKISLKKIVEATNNFENLIGKGGFGKVYKGNLLWTGKRIDIAARRLHSDYGQGDLEFWNEISMLALSGLKHDNLVYFVGYCDEDGQKIIVTKYEAKQSLDVHLKDSNLTWTQRLQICVGIAHALSYIHYDQGHDLSVIHRNIKSSKVLLDEKWEPKLSGFGISLKNSKARRHRYLLAEVIGTIGYVDPTYEKTGFVTHKSDVFSFGVLLFEVLCGRRAFRPDEQEQEQHSPQLFKYDYKQGKLADVVVKLDGITDPHLYNNKKLIKPASLVDVQAPSFSDAEKGNSSSCFNTRNNKPVSMQYMLSDGPPSISDDGYGYRKSASFIGRQPSSFSCGAERRNSSSNIYTRNKPVSITQYKLGDVQPPSVDRRAKNSNTDIPMKSITDVAVSIGPLARAERVDSPSTVTAPSPAKVPTPSPVNLETASPANELTAAASPALVTTTSAVNLPTTSPAEPTAAASPAMVTTTSSVNDQLPIQYDSSTKQDFTLHPLYTMKRLELYIHNPNEELLAQLVRYHYDDLENNLDLDDMIDQALKEQMDPESFKIFSETAFSCLKERQSQRPNIDLILNNLKIALAHQMKRENLGRDLDHLKIPLSEIETATKKFTQKYLGSGAYGKVYRADLMLPLEENDQGGSSRKGELALIGPSPLGRDLDHLKIPLSEIETATKKFTQKYLGSGAYGKVYRADLMLPLEENDQGETAKKRTVAIKCIRDDKHGKEGFVAEIELLTSCKHPNVVSLLGFCDEGPNMILVYEHAPNKSLDDYLGSTNNPIYLTWAQRIKIGLDIARGLHYLHTKVG
nr:receptor-like protein kinase HERK 1 [Tanacetum cinerariifolium]